MQVLHWKFSNRFEPLYSDMCHAAGRAAIFRYIHEIADEGYHEHEGLLLREPVDEPLVIGLRQDLETGIAELTAAHELCHEWLILHGYPLVCSELAMLSPLASAYSSVLSDPLIDRHLGANGYDVGALLRRDDERLMHGEWDARCVEFPFVDPAYEVEILRRLRLALAPDMQTMRGLEPNPLVDELRVVVQNLRFDSPEGQRRALEFLLHYSSARMSLTIFTPELITSNCAR